MSQLLNQDEPKKAEPPSRQGYCGYCRILYSNLDQHLSSQRHLDAVRVASRPAGGRTELTLLERFLQDVLQHHPHRYDDARPSHADLPCVSVVPTPRVELAELGPPEDGQPAPPQPPAPVSSAPAGSKFTARFKTPPTATQATPPREPTTPAPKAPPIFRRACEATPPVKQATPPPIAKQATPPPVAAPIPAQQAPPPPVVAPPPAEEAPPTVHRKAHRKTNRRKASESSSSHKPDPDPWPGWQKERREAQREEVFSENSDLVDRTIEQVIRNRCYGDAPQQQREVEEESLHFSLPVSTETQSEDWDSPLQEVLQRSGAAPAPKPDFRSLLDAQVHVDYQVYSGQLQTALHCEGTTTEGFWTMPIEEVLPAPKHIPASFRGKSWAQIEQEDEERVERIVRQFREGKFISYFDSESLARYGRRSQKKKVAVEEEEEPDVLPLDEPDEDLVSPPRKRKRRSYRMASRCQVVKVSHGTQTEQMLLPAVQAPPAPHTPPAASLPSATPSTESPPVAPAPPILPPPPLPEQTPEAWQRLPQFYSSIITPVQPRTSLVYLLYSAPAAAGGSAPEGSSALKRCKKRRPHELRGLKYKRQPVRFYEPGTNRILKNAPRRHKRCGVPANHVRQLFRNLSANTHGDEEAAPGRRRRRGAPRAPPPSSDAPAEPGRRGRRRATPTKGAPPTPANKDAALQPAANGTLGGSPGPAPSPPACEPIRTDSAEA